jgi:hypothetical protein
VTGVTGRRVPDTFALPPTVSVNAPRLLANTGMPLSIASAATSPNDSFQSEGMMSNRVKEYLSPLSLCPGAAFLSAEFKLSFFNSQFSVFNPSSFPIPQPQTSSPLSTSAAFQFTIFGNTRHSIPSFPR